MQTAIVQWLAHMACNFYWISVVCCLCLPLISVTRPLSVTSGPVSQPGQIQSSHISQKCTYFPSQLNSSHWFFFFNYKFLTKKSFIRAGAGRVFPLISLCYNDSAQTVFVLDRDCCIYLFKICTFLQWRRSNLIEGLAYLAKPLSCLHLLSSIAHLLERGLRLPSIRSRLPAVSFWHKAHGRENPVHHFLIRSFASPSQHISLPHHSPILKALIAALPSLLYDSSDLHLLRAVFLLAFFFCLLAAQRIHK